jgi:hypothetical protein
MSTKKKKDVPSAALADARNRTEEDWAALIQMRDEWREKFETEHQERLRLSAELNSVKKTHAPAPPPSQTSAAPKQANGSGSKKVIVKMCSRCNKQKEPKVEGIDHTKCNEELKEIRETKKAEEAAKKRKLEEDVETAKKKKKEDEEEEEKSDSSSEDEEKKKKEKKHKKKKHKKDDDEKKKKKKKKKKESESE